MLETEQKLKIQNIIGGGIQGEVVIQKNGQSANLNRKTWAKFNIISKELNTLPRIRMLRKLFKFTLKVTPLSYFWSIYYFRFTFGVYIFWEILISTDAS